MVLLSDIVGISALVDAISYPHKPGATESSVLGPFHDEVGQLVENGSVIVKDDTFGEATLVRGQVRSVDGTPVKEALIDVWETDGHGVYDLEYAEKEGPDCRGKFYTDAEGKYAFTCVKPIPYPISNDGPVGELLRTLNRHWFRPAHMVSGRRRPPTAVVSLKLTMSCTAFHDPSSRVQQTHHGAVHQRQQIH